MALNIFRFIPFSIPFRFPFRVLVTPHLCQRAYQSAYVRRMSKTLAQHSISTQTTALESPSSRVDMLGSVQTADVPV